MAKVLCCRVCVLLLQVDHIDLFTNKRAVFTSKAAGQAAAADSSSIPMQLREWAVSDVNP